MAAERAKGLAGQFVMDTHTHFLRDDTRLEGFVRQREAVGRAGWNPTLAGKPQTLEDLKFDNYFKEIFLDSRHQGGAASPARPPRCLRTGSSPTTMAMDARAKVNARLGARRLHGARHLHAGVPGLARGSGPRHHCSSSPTP